MVGRNRSLIIIIVTVYYSLAAPLKLRSYGAIKIRLLLLFASRGQYTTALIAYLPSIALSLRAEVPRRSTPGIKGMTNCPSFKRAVVLASGRRAFRQDRSSSGGTADKPLDIPPSRNPQFSRRGPGRTQITSGEDQPPKLFGFSFSKTAHPLRHEHGT